jgi:hypothetical protein
MSTCFLESQTDLYRFDPSIYSNSKFNSKLHLKNSKNYWTSVQHLLESLAILSSGKDDVSNETLGGILESRARCIHEFGDLAAD